MKNGWAGFFALAFLVAACADSGDDPEAKSLALAAIGDVKRGPNLADVQVDKATKTDYTLKLIYAGAPAKAPSRSSIQLDTYQIAHAVLARLVAAGQHPASDRTFVWVWAERPAGKGETNEDLVQMYGHAEYEPDNDLIEFKPWKP